MINITVNVVIFAGGKFRANVGKTFHMKLFSRYLSYFLHEGIWVLFSRGGFCEEDHSAKPRISPRHENSHVYSIFVGIMALSWDCIRSLFSLFAS